MKFVIILVIAIVLLCGLGMCAVNESSSDCYTTGEPGSAQEQRDIERCLGQ